jgi:hypothetical protein
VRAGRVRVGVSPRGLTSLAVLVGYVAIGFIYLGLRLLLEPEHQYVGYGADPQIFIWSLDWWPHAVTHGENPFVTHAVWAPGSINMTWVTSVPGLALLLSPVTLLAGPIAAYNVAAVLMPALGAWTAFLLCRRLTGAAWPSLVGGYLFGFSSYALGQAEGHLHCTAVFAIPLVALVILRYLDGELGAAGAAVRLGVLFAVQLLISTEVTFTLALALVVTLALAYAFVPSCRRRIAGLQRPLAASVVIAAILTAPFLYYAITGFQSEAAHPPAEHVADLLNYVVPTKLSVASLGWASGISRSFSSNSSEQGAYLGVPALVIVALYARPRIGTAGGRFLVACLGVAVLVSLGARLRVDGHKLFSLPWALVGGLPLFDNVLTVRFALYAALLTAVVVALWTAARPAGWSRWALPALAVLAVLPNPWTNVWATTYRLPEFFTSSTYRDCLDPGENILPLPVGQDGVAMLWQTTADFRFTMAGGYLASHPPGSFVTSPAIDEVASGATAAAGDSAALAEYIQAKHVTAVVLDRSRVLDWSPALDKLAPSHEVGGVVLYRFETDPPYCPGA